MQKRSLRPAASLGLFLLFSGCVSIPQLEVRERPVDARASGTLLVGASLSRADALLGAQWSDESTQVLLDRLIAHAGEIASQFGYRLTVAPQRLRALQRRKETGLAWFFNRFRSAASPPFTPSPRAAETLHILPYSDFFDRRKQGSYDAAAAIKQIEATAPDEYYLFTSLIYERSRFELNLLILSQSGEIVLRATGSARGAPDSLEAARALLEEAAHDLTHRAIDFI